MTLFYTKTKERLHFYQNLQPATTKENTHTHMLKIMVDRMEKQPHNINQQHDIMDMFSNLDNFPLLQILWSTIEQRKWKAELHHLSKYLQPKQHHYSK
jgi:hypothetical protein